MDPNCGVKPTMLAQRFQHPPQRWKVMTGGPHCAVEFLLRKGGKRRFDLDMGFPITLCVMFCAGTKNNPTKHDFLFYLNKLHFWLDQILKLQSSSNLVTFEVDGCVGYMIVIFFQAYKINPSDSLGVFLGQFLEIKLQSVCGLSKQCPPVAVVLACFPETGEPHGWPRLGNAMVWSWVTNVSSIIKWGLVVELCKYYWIGNGLSSTCCLSVDAACDQQTHQIVQSWFFSIYACWKFIYLYTYIYISTWNSQNMEKKNILWTNEENYSLASSILGNNILTVFLSNCTLHYCSGVRFLEVRTFGQACPATFTVVRP